MIPNEHSNYYDILEITPDASAQEVRNAYMRTKAAFHKDSAALYTLINEDEAERLLKLVEEAYHVLSSPEKRKDYDVHHGLLMDKNESTARHTESKKIIPIDRSAPMKSSGSEKDILVPPSTDLVQTKEPQNSKPPAFQTSTATDEDVLESEIAAETEWTGYFLKRIRLARRVSIEEMAEITKISKTYITAIEEDNYAKLPASVYLRGFITQIARTLKLPLEKTVAAYMARLTASKNVAKTGK